VNLVLVMRAVTLPVISRFVMLLAVSMAVASLTLVRFLFLFVSGKLISNCINVVVVGYNENSQRFINTVLRHKVYGYRLLGVIDEQGRENIRGSDGIRGDIEIKYLGKVRNIEQYAGMADSFFVFPPTDIKDREFIAQTAEKHNIQCYWLPENSINLFYNVDFLYIGNKPYLRKKDTKTTFYYEFAKRLMDIILSILFLIILSPFILVIAIIIKAGSGGKVLFKQKRVGKNGKKFFIYKFRTMQEKAPRYAMSPLDREDPRITGVGRFLRKFSLDELPQLINVIKGEMSLVGPRPEMHHIVKRYTSFERLRLKVKPGLTGIWQISSERQKPIHYSIEYDIFYIYNRSLTLDSAILLETFLFLMNPRGI